MFDESGQSSGFGVVMQTDTIKAIKKAEHERIWLEPSGAPDRCWCQDNQWGEDGVEYVLASTLESLQRENGALKEEASRLEDENSDLRYQPWPEWARAVLKVIRSGSGYDGYDDATEGVDMPLELSEHLSEMQNNADRQQARAEAAESEVKRLRGALEPFTRIEPVSISTADGHISSDAFRRARAALSSTGDTHGN